MSEELETNPIEDLIDALAAQNFNNANDRLNDILGQKMGDALDAEKINLASQIFNEPSDDQLDLDLEEDDEEVVFDEVDE
jgi:hypothetical protein